MSKTEPARQLAFPWLDPIECEILELQFATISIEILISEFPPLAPPILAREHAHLSNAGAVDLGLVELVTSGESGAARPPPT